MAQDMSAGQAKVNVDANFEQQLRQLKTNAAAEFQALTQLQQNSWNRPALGDWDGNLDDWEGIAKAFTRQQANDEYTQALADAKAPGVAGDTIAAPLMADYLGCLERAYHNRHQSWHRALMHSAGRKQGHGSDNGPLTVSVLEFLRNIIKRTKGESA